MEQKERNKKTRKIRKNSTVRKKIKNVIEIDLSLATVQSSGNECSMNVSTDQPNRINTINNVFQTLRKCIPTFPYERRLSKIDTLHLTISYIHLLQSIIHSDLTLFDYLCQTLDYLINNSNNNSVSCRFVKPLWATSDLVVRLHWLNWSALGVNLNEINLHLNLFNQIYEISMQL